LISADDVTRFADARPFCGCARCRTTFSFCAAPTPAVTTSRYVRTNDEAAMAQASAADARADAEAQIVSPLRQL
jgi:hypothetical protein